MVQFKRYQTLIVIHANHRVVISANGLVKKAIGRKRARGLNASPFGRSHRGSDDRLLLVAENSLFAAMGIQGGHGDAGISGPAMLSVMTVVLMPSRLRPRATFVKAT